MSSDEKGKGLLVVVRRGAHVDIAERDRPPRLLEDEIQLWSHSDTWEEFRREHHDCEARKMVEDKYEDVDHNVWVLMGGITWKGSRGSQKW